MADLFFLNFESSSSFITLEEDDFHHIIRVCRHEEGDILSVSNGKGIKASGRLTQVTKKSAICELSDMKIAAPPPLKLILALPYLKQLDRLEEAIFQSTQLGIDEFLLFKADRCQRSHLFDAQKKRLLSILKSGSEVAERAFLPPIHYLESLTDLAAYPHIYFGQIGAPTALDSIDYKNSPLLLLIGPEGDFTERELTWLTTHKAQGVNLGTQILRAETAAIAGATLLTHFRIFG